MDTPSVDGERLWGGLHELGRIGDRGDGAMMRVTGSDADRRARDYFVDRLETAGLDVRIDHVGNIYGRLAGRSSREPIIIGSHLDTVPNGGKFDGAAGVLAALEVIESWNDAAIEPRHPVEVVAFTEEEGTRFGTGLLGSAVASGRLTTEDALELRDDNGATLEAVLDEIGYRGDTSPILDELTAYIELHVEQGPTLDSAGIPVGLVEAITGLCQLEVRIHGEANHAGATSMSSRRDSLAAVAEVSVKIEREARSIAKRTDAVATIGSVDVEPNAANVIPETVRFTLDIRDTDETARQRLKTFAIETIETIASERQLKYEYEEWLDVEATPMDGTLVDRLASACHSLDIDHLRLPSGGGHDAMNLAEICPAAMVFVPSEGGISHNPAEHTDRADLVAGTRVLEHTVRSLAVEDPR